MKYVVVLADGAADTPVKELNGQTPLEAANKPTIDSLARHSEVGMVKTVPNNPSSRKRCCESSSIWIRPSKILYRAFSAGGCIYERSA